MALTGLLVGWRVARGHRRRCSAAFVLLLVFAYAISWIMAWVGLIVPSVEVINNASFIVIMPLTFVSNAFVPTESFPAVAAAVRRVEPGLGAHPGGARAVRQRRPDGVPVPDAWALQNPVLYTLLWVVLILVVFVPLSVRAYQRASSK